MDKLASVSRAALHKGVGDISTGKAVKRLIIPPTYKDGVSMETFSDCYAIPRSTVYYWLDRFEEIPVDKAIEDDDGCGQSPYLMVEEQDEL